MSCFANQNKIEVYATASTTISSSTTDPTVPLAA